MNELLERALSEVSILKKTLNSEKTSHQNTLQQLQTTYQIIEEMKKMLKNQQDKNKAATREIKQKNNKIQEISRDYEDHLMDIKELIDRKDLQIKKYTQIKVTDYDMIRFRVINEVEAQHQEELELLKKQIQKQQFINNERIYQNKVLKQKNIEYSKEIDELKQRSGFIEQQLLSNHTRQLNKVYGLLEQQKLSRKQLQKRIQHEKQKYSETIKKYHKQMETLQSQLKSQFSGKENLQRHPNVSNSSSLIQLKESQFAVENEKLKRQVRQKTDQLDQMTKKHKSETRQFNRRIDELEKQLREAQYQIKRLQEDLKDSKITVEQELTNKWKRELDKKQKSLKDSYDSELQAKDNQLQKVKRQLQNARNSLDRNETYKFGPKLQDQRQDNFKLQRDNEELKAQLKKSTIELVQLKNKRNEDQNRHTRAVSVQDVKEKLKTANAKIVTLLKDKIELTEKLSRMSEMK